MEFSRSLYLELLRKVLLNWPYRQHEYGYPNTKLPIDSAAIHAIQQADFQVVTRHSFPDEVRRQGLGWPPYAHTMIGEKRLLNLQRLAEKVLQDDIQGDFIETGVWRGGASILMRAVLKAYQVNDRVVWVADSFEGLPAPNPEKYPLDKGLDFHKIPQLAVSLETVQENFASYGLLDEQVRFLRGWFSETLPDAPIKKLSLMRLDGDLYESTMDALVNLYPKLSLGGYIIVDDYYDIEACQQAVHDYRTERKITDEIIQIDASGAYWCKMG